MFAVHELPLRCNMLHVQGSEVEAASAQPALEGFVVYKKILLLSCSDKFARDTVSFAHELAYTYA